MLLTFKDEEGKELHNCGHILWVSNVSIDINYGTTVNKVDHRVSRKVAKRCSVAVWEKKVWTLQYVNKSFSHAFAID